MASTVTREFGSFLQARRAALQPSDVGLLSYGARRVPGLRREELAQLAGVSVAYYTRMEQGQTSNASEGVLDAIARALRFDEDERRHLYTLARPGRPSRRSSRAERVRPNVERMIDALTEVPACVLGRRMDILAWNGFAHALLAGHLGRDSPSRPAERPNMARMVFLDPHTRDLFADWDAKASEAVSYLRLAAGRHPDDPALASLVGELLLKSPEFAGLWSSHVVRDKTYGVRRFRHPLVGALTLSYEGLRLPDGEQLLVTFNAEPGSPSDAALKLLAGLILRERDS